MTRLIPSLFSYFRVRPIDQYPALLHAALRSVAPVADGEATIACGRREWPTAPTSSTPSSPVRWASSWSKLRSGRPRRVCYMRTTSGLARVNAIYRRLDDAYIDPLEFRPDSLLGVPGLIRALSRRERGDRQRDRHRASPTNKAIYCYVPEMIRFYLGEEPLLSNVVTYRLEDLEQREAALARIDQLVFKPTGESGGSGVVIGPAADERRLADLAVAVRRDPAHWIAQEVVHLSTVPTVRTDGTLAARHVDLRPFAIVGEEIRIVPGGLTRVALEPGSLIVNSRAAAARRTPGCSRTTTRWPPTRRCRRTSTRRRCPICVCGRGPVRHSSSSSSRWRHPDARADRPRAVLARAQRLAGRALAR